MPKAGGLLIIEYGGGAIADLLTADDVMCGKLDILRKQEEVPAAALLQNAPGEQEPGAGHTAACTEHSARAVQILCLTQKPQTIAGGDPVIAIVFGIAVTGHNVVSGRKGLVDLPNIVRICHIVRIEYKVGIVAFFDSVKQKLQSIFHISPSFPFFLRHSLDA